MAKRSPSGLAPVQLRAGASPHLPPFSITSCGVSWFDSHRHVVPRPPAPRGDTPGDSPAVAVPPPQPPNTHVQDNLLPLPLRPSVFTLSPFLGGPRCVLLRGRGGSWPRPPPVLCCSISHVQHIWVWGGVGLGGGAAGWEGGRGARVCFWGTLLGVALWQLSSVSSSVQSVSLSQPCGSPRPVPGPGGG